MKKTKTSLSGLFIIENTSFLDERGEFMELWNQHEFELKNLNTNATQDNISISKKNVIRGLHFQNNPYGQIKYVRVIQGRILDVAVDIRKTSDTFGQHHDDRTRRFGDSDLGQRERDELYGFKR